MHFLQSRQAVLFIVWMILSGAVRAQYWQPNYKFNRSYMGCVEFMDKDTGFAAGPKLYRTTDAGKTWSLQNASLSNYSVIHFADAQVGYACGENNLVLKTVNGGASWQSIPTSHSDDDFYAISTVDADTIFFVAMDDVHTYKYAKYIHYSYDGGSNWQRRSTGSTQTMRCMHMWNSKTGIIGQLTAGIIRTTDAWSSYSTINAGLQITGMDVIKDSVVVLVGNNGKIARSSDYGQSFKSITSPTSNHLTNVHFANDSFGMACGYNGTILLSTDGGLSWSVMSSGTSAQVNDVEVINPFYAWFIVHSPTDSFDTYKFGSEKYVSNEFNIISGNIAGDLNGNCSLDQGEGGASGILVKADPGGYMTYTRRNGDFELIVTDTGNFSLKTKLPEKYLVGDGLCDSVIGNIRFTALDQRSRGNQFLFETDTTAKLQVQISSPRQRRCGNNSIQIRYKNLGFRPADSVDLTFFYPEDLIGISKASKSYSSGTNQLSFKLGKLSAGQEGLIELTDTVFCRESNRNNTVCLKVLITPKVLVLNEDWDSSWIRSKMDCYDSLVILKVYNDGETMKDSGELDLFLGEVHQDRLRYRLSEGDSMRWQVNRGSDEVITYGDVRKYHPYQEEIRVWRERCRNDSVLKVNKITKHRMVNLRSFEDEICVPIRDSYDPNDIRVFPSGITDDQWISNEQKLNYVVRFQNTGNDTAFVVRVVDTLPVQLDPYSLEMVGSSHKMEISLKELKGKTVLTCVFENINLVDSATNPALSEGWFSFVIRPITNLKHRTQIDNFVDIYFDYNPPLRTNIAWVRIYDSTSTPRRQVRAIPCSSSFDKIFSDTVVCNKRELISDLPVTGPNKPDLFSLTSGLTVLRLGDYQFRLSVAHTGSFQVVRTLMDCDQENRDTVEIRFEDAPRATLSDSTICFQADYWLNIPCSDCRFRWNDGSDSSAYHVLSTGTFSVLVDNVCGQIQDSCRVDVLPKKTLHIGRDTIVCDGSQLQLSSNLGPQTLWWSGRYTERITVVNDGSYQAQYTDACQKLKDTIFVRFRSSPVVDAGKDTQYCDRVDHAVQLPLIDFEHRIAWNDQSTSYNRQFTEPGVYSVRSENLCGIYLDTLRISLKLSPNLNLGQDTGFCGPFSHLLLKPETDSGTQFDWVDIKYSGDRFITEAGMYVGILSNECGTVTDSITITQYPMPKADWVSSNVCDTGLIYFLSRSHISDASPLRHEWDLNSEFFSTQRDPTVDFTENGKKKIRLLVRSRDNCTDSISRELALGWFARSNFNWSDPVCAGRPIIFSNSSFATSPSLSYHWDMGNDTSYTQEAPVHFFRADSATKTFSITLISTPPEGCADTLVKEVIVHGLPKAQIRDSAYRNQLFLEAAQLSANTQVHWTSGGSLLGSGPQLRYKMQTGEFGTVCAEFMTIEGCTDTICHEFQNTWNIKGNWQVFPNPAADYVECIFSDKSQRVLSLYGSDGRKILEQHVEGEQVILDLRHVVTGNYILESISDLEAPLYLQLIIY